MIDVTVVIFFRLLVQVVLSSVCALVTPCMPSTPCNSCCGSSYALLSLAARDCMLRPGCEEIEKKGLH